MPVASNGYLRRYGHGAASAFGSLMATAGIYMLASVATSLQFAQGHPDLSCPILRSVLRERNGARAIGLL
jgi:hypothetical protein